MSSATGKTLLETSTKASERSMVSIEITGHMTIIVIFKPSYLATDLNCKPFLPAQQKIK